MIYTYELKNEKFQILELNTNCCRRIIQFIKSLI